MTEWRLYGVLHMLQVLKLVKLGLDGLVRNLSMAVSCQFMRQCWWTYCWVPLQAHGEIRLMGSEVSRQMRQVSVIFCLLFK